MPLYFPVSCTSHFLFHIGIHLSGPSSTLSVSCPPAYTRSVAFLSNSLPPIQPSPTSVSALHLPLSHCLFHIVHCCFHFFLSYLIHFQLSHYRHRELEATCCSFSVQQLLEVCRPYPQHFLVNKLSVMSLPLLSLITAPLFTFLLSSVLSRANMNIIFLPPSSSSFRYSYSSKFIRARSSALLAAFFFCTCR